MMPRPEKAICGQTAVCVQALRDRLAKALRELRKAKRERDAYLTHLEVVQSARMRGEPLSVPQTTGRMRT